MERGSAGNSRIASTGSETGYGSRGSMAYLHSGLENSAGVNAVTSSRQTNSNDIDNNLVREIAEVYMRMSNCPLESAVRPDLDLEDKYEKEREVLERKFLSEKREMKRKLEENYTHKLEQERSGYESSLQELKSTISELQWQKRELESKIRTEKEKCEISFEREKNELEKRQINSFHEYKKQLDEKYSAQLERQKVKYEENITDLQGDIMNLTLQLRELNESLSQEKDIIIERFEKEIREMEHTFAEQRNSMKFSLESEFSLKLQNETSVLKTINKKLQDDLETLEKDKKEVSIPAGLPLVPGEYTGFNSETLKDFGLEKFEQRADRIFFTQEFSKSYFSQRRSSESPKLLALFVICVRGPLL
ncbi:predicted protein [Nematostella vectensis]|uniref:Uncharacterized protein n=1 Tax=Nematostella vectensis TaxID=45351 RepID=A7T0B3_NEMVE|nr:predicted protein [Nematostella vectensis]|eukprot:XP_001622706.1 predicted protein [Nematostella vectensis]